MIVNIIGWLCIGFFAMDFILAIVENRHENQAKGYKLEAFAIAYLLIAAICFK